MLPTKLLMRQLSDKETNLLQKESPDIIILQKNDEQFAQGRILLEELHAKEKQYPILKRTDDSLKLFNLRNAVNRAQYELIEELDYMPITAVIQNWLITLEKNTTQIKYTSYMTDLMDKNIIPTTFADGRAFSIGGLRHINQKSILQYIEHMNDLSKTAKIARIECYTSFSIFLERITNGWFRRALPITSQKRSVYRSTIKTSQKALSLDELKKFNTFLAKNNYRDYLISSTMFYGAVRISDVLTLTLEQIDFSNNIIRFLQYKNKIKYEKPIEYPKTFMKKLNDYIASTQEQRADNNHIFITRNGRSLTRSRLNHSFTNASKEAKIRRVQPDTMRATWLALNQNSINIINEILIEE